MKIIAGVDEVGRGSLVGPVYAAAVILNKSIKKKLIVNVVDGIIYINEIHLEGKKSLKISDFLNGFKVPENSYFS